MLLVFSLSAFLLRSISAQAGPLASEPTAFLGSCNNRLQGSQSPGLYNVVYDTDPNFVYNASECTSTNQKIIPFHWARMDCGPAIEAVCGTTTANGDAVGSWSWGWHTGSEGATCQAGLWQAIDARTNGVGILDPICCLLYFRDMVDSLTHPGSQGLDPAQGNRFSVNIAPGGFPYTKVQYPDGQLVNVNGAQIASGHPSYILQGYGDAFQKGL
ncbi:MAG: hypothetical protein Q9208_005716 [Pyrenodesmia sp. 3 TL-2023]